MVGIEPFPETIGRCRELAAQTAGANVSFKVGAAESIPFPDGSFDAVLSFDVLEHVQDPRRAFREIHRVLRAGGHGWLVFPTYLGARSSHLDFITRIPALHRIFDPETIVAVVNDELDAGGGRWGVRRLAPAAVSDIGHLTLPNLNGLTRREALALMREADLGVSSERVSPFVRPSDPVPGAHLLAELLARWPAVRPLPELLIGSLAYHVVRE